MDVLSCHLCQSRPVVPGLIPHDIEVDHPSLASVFSVLVVAHFVDHKEEINKIAGGPKLLVFRIWIGVRDKKLVAAGEEECELFPMEYIEAVDPGTGFGGGGLVVRARGTLDRADGEEIGENDFAGHWYCQERGGRKLNEGESPR